MTLSTQDDLPITSPFPKAQHGRRDALALEDVSERWSVFHVRGRDASGMLAQVFGVAPPPVSGASPVDDGLLANVRGDEFIILVRHEDVAALAEQITHAAGGAHITVTDVTHGRGLMSLSGPLAPDVLPKLCALDFHDEAFPNQHVAQTSLAKVRALLIRLDDDAAIGRAYFIAVDRSLAAYAWDALTDAMREFLDEGTIPR